MQFAPIPPADWLDRYYESGEFWHGVGLDPTVYIDQWLTHLPQRTFIDLVRRAADALSADKTRFHDVGCGYGGLTKALRDNGFDATGSDLNASAIAFGQRLGLPITLGGIPELLKMEPQHIITAYHVAEHFLDPNAFLTAVERTLKPGGFLVLAVPNGAYAPARRDNFGRYDWCFFPGHIHYYTPRSIADAFQRHGFEIVSMESNSDSEAGMQLEWLVNVMTAGHAAENCDRRTLLETMDRSLQSRDLRVVGRKPPTRTPRRSRHGQN